MLPLLAALLLAAPADQAGTHVDIVAGAGMAEDFLGAHLQLRYDHLAAFVGTGLPLLVSSDGYHRAGVIGARWYSGLGDRFFLSTQFSFVAWQQLITHDELGGREILTPFRAYTLTVVGAWRWRRVLLAARRGRRRNADPGPDRGGGLRVLRRLRPRPAPRGYPRISAFSADLSRSRMAPQSASASASVRVRSAARSESPKATLFFPSGTGAPR